VCRMVRLTIPSVLGAGLPQSALLNRNVHDHPETQGLSVLVQQIKDQVIVLVQKLGEIEIAPQGDRIATGGKRRAGACTMKARLQQTKEAR
jgi:hypothetical protein